MTAAKLLRIEQVASKCRGPVQQFLTCTTLELAQLHRMNWTQFPKSKFGFGTKFRVFGGEYLWKLADLNIYIKGWQLT